MHQETSDAGTAEADNSREPARDAGSEQYETAERADQEHREYTETDAEVEARIADQDELPAREESRQASWGDNPDYYDETDLATEYDGDLVALTAEEDQLPARPDSRAATWGDNPEYDDVDPVGGQEHVAALTTEADGPAARDATASPDADDTHAESAVATEADRPPELQGAADHSTSEHLGPPDHAESSSGDVGEHLSPEAAQLKSLEAERDQARQQIADLKAENAEQTALIEQLQASTDRDRGGEASTPERGADERGTSPDQDPLLSEQIATDQRADTKEHVRAWRRRAPSAEDIGAVGLVVGAAGGALSGTSAKEAVATATVIGAVAYAKAKLEKHQKGKP